MEADRIGLVETRRILMLIGMVLCLHPATGRAQVGYIARFALEKESYLLGEPIFCTFSMRNTGSQPFAFSYRNPTRILNPELESEPKFSIVDAAGRPLADPAPQPCGGAKGTAVYGSVTLPPGRVHAERWLINQWARFQKPGKYRLRAERRLPLLGLNAANREFTGPPAAYALAVDEVSFEVSAASASDLQAAFQGYEKALEKPGTAEFQEAVVAVTALPQPFLLEKLIALASASPQEQRWDRGQALEGLARLGTPAAWDAVLAIVRGKVESASNPSQPPGGAKEDSLRGEAVLLLAEKGDPGFIPPILGLLPGAPDTFRGEILRALGFFRDARTIQVLFERLHSSAVNDRINAILGLRNMESKEVIPALIAMLNDPESEARQVANFALRSLTGQSFKLSSIAPAAESARVQAQWRAWWQKQGASFVPVRQAPCRDW